jgi:predicted RND superfamily exporter protein
MEEANDIIEQLKNIPKEAKQVTAKPQMEPLEKEEVEQFIIDKSSKLISDSMEMIENMKEVVFHVPDADNVSSLAELIKASTGAIETLNKLVTQDKKSQTQIQVKQLDIQSKKMLQDSEQDHKLKLSREDILKNLIDGKDVIEVPGEELTE